MRLRPHLTFDGKCQAAFLRYQQVFGGSLMVLTYGESPMAASVDAEWHDRVVHATLRFDEEELAGADVLPRDYRKPQGLFVLVSVEGLAKAERIFASLAEGGEVQLPFQKAFWSEGFGVLVDAFGVPWEISTES